LTSNRGFSLWLEVDHYILSIMDLSVYRFRRKVIRQHFNEAELVNLTLAITAINTWNRIAISFRPVPGSYQPSPAA
jgi:hypothetical protein